MKARWLLFLVCALPWLTPSAGNGQAPAASREFVYGIQALVDRDYTGIFSPSEVPNIYLRADSTAILLPRYTLVYYWPIDRQFKPDWASLNEPASGTLEVVKDGRVISQIPPSSYLVVPRADGGWIRAQLLLNDQARHAYRDYVKRRDQYLAMVSDYDSRLEVYFNQKALHPNDATLQSPMPPPQFTEAMSPPQEGHPVRIAAGTYDIRLRGPNGQVVPNSTRHVVAVAPRRESIGYDVIPESKWTAPESSDDRNQIIYYSGQASTIYMRPIRVQEFNELEYTRLTRLQDTIASPVRWIWVRGEPVSGARLRVYAGNHQGAELSVKPYTTKQLPGSALGYQIIPFDAKTSPTPDLQAIAVPMRANLNRFTVQLVRGDGTPLAGSERDLVRARADVPPLGYGFVVLPLAAGIVVQIRGRRLRARSLRRLADAGV
jgi:hypothetical protein